MGLFSFIKEAGEKLFGGSAAQAAEPAQDLNAKAAKAIETYIGTQNLGVSDVKVQFDGSQGKVTVQGTAPTQAVKEKVTLCCGNVSSVQSVDNQMAVTSPEPEAPTTTWCAATRCRPSPRSSMAMPTSTP
jgi:osmotically-inducible protein OsmY